MTNMFSHEVAIVLSSPGWRTHSFSRNHDYSSSGRNITNSTWCIVVIQVLYWISRDTIIRFIFNTLNHTFILLNWWRREVKCAWNIIVRIVRYRQSFSADPLEHWSWFLRLFQSRPAKRQCHLGKRSFPTWCRSLQKYQLFVKNNQALTCLITIVIQICQKGPLMLFLCSIISKIII